MADSFVVLGTFPFKAQDITVGALPRDIITSTNCLAAEPVQTVAYTSGYMQVTIEGVLEGKETAGETAEAHLTRMRANLRTEVAKDSNTLTITWPGGAVETFRVFKNNDYDQPLEWHVSASFVATYVVTLNCLS